MTIAEILKQQKFFQDIEKKCDEGRLSPTTLFFCEDDVTSRVVLVLTALKLEFPNTFALMDENSGDFVRISSGADLDVKVFPKGEKLLVEDSGDIVSEANVKPVNLPYKIFIIHNIDSSTEAAQNKLLKVIEEPPRNVFFLISAKNEQKVLPTIKSRCEKIKIGPLSQEEISSICEKPLPVILGRGFIGRTQEYAKMENLDEIVKLGISLATNLKNSKQVILFSKKLLDQQENLPLVLEVLQIALEDIMKMKCESENLCKLIPFENALKEVEPEFSVLAICEICKLISHFMEKVEFNANLTVAVDNFLLKMLEVKYLCK